MNARSNNLMARVIVIHTDGETRRLGKYEPYTDEARRRLIRLAKTWKKTGGVKRAFISLKVGPTYH